MSIIEFPNNAIGYYRKGIHAMETQKFDLAREYFEKSIQTQYSDDAFEELVFLYSMLRIVEPLEQLWQTYYPSQRINFDNEWLLNLYATSVPIIISMPASLLTLYQLKDTALENHWNTEVINELINALNQSQQIEEQIITAIHSEEIVPFINQQINTGFFKLLETLKHLYTVNDYTRFLPYYRALLVHPDVLQFIKSDILHYFINQKITEEIELYHSGQTLTLDVAKLRSYQESRQFIATMFAIQEYCEKENPHLVTEFLHQLTLQSMVFYPFINETLTNPQHWIELMLTDTPISDDDSLYKAIHTANDELSQLF